MIGVDGLTYGGVAVSGMSLVTLTKNAEYLKAAAVCAGVAVVLVIATQFRLVPLTVSELSLVWFLPGLAALDQNRRAIPTAIVVPLFGFAALCHWMLFNSFVPLVALLIAALFLVLPWGRRQFEAGDRVVVAWLIYAFGMLGFVAATLAVVSCAGRKDAPYVTHVSCAAAALLLPLAFLCEHFGRLPWRF